jgi:hypothetical protein
MLLQRITRRGGWLADFRDELGRRELILPTGAPRLCGGNHRQGFQHALYKLRNTQIPTANAATKMSELALRSSYSLCSGSAGRAPYGAVKPCQPRKLPPELSNCNAPACPALLSGTAVRPERDPIQRPGAVAIRYRFDCRATHLAHGRGSSRRRAPTEVDPNASTPRARSLARDPIHKRRPGANRRDCRKAR